MCRSLVLAIAMLALAAAPVGADGGPIAAGAAGGAGIAHGDTRYVALRTHDGTVVLRIGRDRGVVRRSRVIRAPRGITLVTDGGQPTGLSGDGHVLVLADPTYPRRISRFTVLDADSLDTIAEITLHGDFSIDAVSPAGDRLYLIQTLSAATFRYAVRAYDVGRHRLLPEPVVDPDEADEPMTGIPTWRVTSPGGRWAYTLYTRVRGEPFIHALDTQEGIAKCVDLDGAGPVVYMVRGRDGTLLVRSADETLRVVDTRTWAVRRPHRAAPAAATVPDDERGWLAPVAGVALLALVGIGATKAGRLR